MSTATAFPITIFDHDSEVFSGSVTAVSSLNESGPFDVLGKHTNFISTVEKYVVLHLEGGSTKEISIRSGVLRCLDTHVSVYVVPSSDEGGR